MPINYYRHLAPVYTKMSIFSDFAGCRDCLPIQRGVSRDLNGLLVVYLISPQPWHGFHVSKHHYALELASRGNLVYFIDNVSTPGPLGRICLQQSGVPGLTVVHHTCRLARWTQYRLPSAHRSIAAWQARRLIRKIGHPPNVIWDFDNNYSFPDLRRFGDNALRIFHPVDSSASGRRCSKSADVVFSVAQAFINSLDVVPEDTLVVPHGLSRHHEAYAHRIVGGDAVKPSARKARRAVGYVANLDIAGIDWPVILDLISKFKDVDFFFVGPYTPSTGSTRSPVPVAALMAQPNAHLLGFLGSEDILKLASDIDVWLFCNDRTCRPDGAINSHKLLEYLATGKAVLSSAVEAFEDIDLIAMAPRERNAVMLELLDRMLHDVRTLNNFTAMQARAAFALKHTYSANLERIADFLQASNYSVDWLRRGHNLSGTSKMAGATGQ